MRLQDVGVRRKTRTRVKMKRKSGVRKGGKRSYSDSAEDSSYYTGLIYTFLPSRQSVRDDKTETQIVVKWKRLGREPRTLKEEHKLNSENAEGLARGKGELKKSLQGSSDMRSKCESPSRKWEEDQRRQSGIIQSHVGVWNKGLREKEKVDREIRR